MNDHRRLCLDNFANQVCFLRTRYCGIEQFDQAISWKEKILIGFQCSEDIKLRDNWIALSLRERSSGDKLFQLYRCINIRTG